MPASSISTLGAITSPRPASWTWAITTARRDCRGISNRGSRPFGAKPSPPGRAVPPMRPADVGGLRAASSGSSWDDTLATTSCRAASTHRYCPMPRRNSERSVAVIDVPFAPISGALDIRSKITGGPGLRVAAGNHVVEPDARQYLIAAASPGVRYQLADQRQIANRGAEAAGGAGRAQAIDRDVGASAAPSAARSIRRSDQRSGGRSPARPPSRAGRYSARHSESAGHAARLVRSWRDRTSTDRMAPLPDRARMCGVVSVIPLAYRSKTGCRHPSLPIRARDSVRVFRFAKRALKHLRAFVDFDLAGLCR